ncbi:hypothetical protein CY34DRAFT_392632 [Suillus luteus UH-Slu-Lm8-n1]|uniref:WD40 repeat-like protein n=1 Tax=Suillus luteus UH-Slu-Lm8-n1 TaxID=930992 RepID=A0A0D0B3L9_9AGAM|nr:hypothetical protein CY34DRAFT_392632 [Suillus luteus UH-Slu-Lm8-n1]
MDVQRFVQLFGGMILHSTPHLYASALPFSPINSTIARRFTERFPNTLRVIHGRLVNWTAIQTVISGRAGWVHSVSFSPDGTRIVSGSRDSTVRVWDAVTGLPLGEPFRRHSDLVWSVSFSPDGTRIVSGPRDSTVRVWDAATAQQFQEHTEIHSSALSLHRHRTICFSSSLEHALQNSAELLETTSHVFNPTGLGVPKDGWMVGADRRLLFWVPPPTREKPLYHPGTVFVIPSGLEIDLSRMSHGEHWANCRDG